MSRSHRAGLAALLVGSGLFAGVLLTTGLQWTPVTHSEEVGTKHLLGAQGAVPEDLLALEKMSKAFVRVAEIVNPSVVTISSERVVRPASGNRRELPENHPFREFFGDDFFDRFFWHGPGQEDQRSRGLGSGVIVSADGFILTNNHVVADADEITVRLMDDRDLKAKVVGTDKDSDVALIKVEAKDLPAVRFGDSDKLDVGEWVVAIGSPFSENLAHTVTAGIVSAKGRTQVGIVDFEDFIQTDAAINPGNSGGALVNLRGELVGINTAIATRTGFYQGVGFAIPVNMARKVMDDLLNEGKVVRGWLGVVIQPLDDELAASFGLDSKRGVVVNELTKGGPADRAGIKRGDVILDFEGTPVKDADHLQSLVAARDPESAVNLRVRREGKDRTIQIKLGERPQNPREAFAHRGEGGGEEGGEPAAPVGERLGLRVEPLTPNLARELGYEGDNGVVVGEIDRSGPAATKNVRRGDLIKEVNRKPVTSVADFDAALKEVKPGESALLLLQRDETTFFTAIKVSEKKE